MTFSFRSEIHELYCNLLKKRYICSFLEKSTFRVHKHGILGIFHHFFYTLKTMNKS